jgi:LuxR family transcriptional regulator, maltose regulon positive regulatory protein
MSAATATPAPSFAVTKIRPPSLRAGTVARARLDAALVDALATARLVLVTAPAGFGKTVALARAIALTGPDTAVAWMGAEADDDLSRVAACIVTALEPFDLPWRVSPEAAAAAFDGATALQRRALANEFINTLSATEVKRGLIVIDDAHLLQDASIFAFVDQMVERMPPHWCIVVASRVEPPLALARLRALGELAEFRQEDLRFEIDEVRALVQGTAQGAGLPRAVPLEAEALIERTQGWAAGLVLALRSRKADGTLTERHVFDYVAAEVLDEMPTPKRLFLMRCSVLGELTAARCAAVSGDRQAALWLGQIEQQGLFASVRGDGAESALRLHELFRDCLEHLLRRERPDELPGLLKRAAAGEPDPLRRVGYLLRAQAWDEARKALSDAAPALLTVGAVSQLNRLIEQFPPHARDEPEFETMRGLAAWARWEFPAMRQAMHRAAAAYARAGREQGRQWAQAHEALALLALIDADAARPLVEALAKEPLEGEALIVTLHAQSWLAVSHGPLDQVYPFLEREYEEIEKRPSAALWYKAAPSVRSTGLPGFRRVASRYIAGALASAPEGPSALRLLANLMQGWIEVWSGRPDAALAILQSASDDARWLGQGRVLGSQVDVALAFTHALRGDVASALEAIRRPLTLLADLPPGSRRSFLEAQFLGIEIRVALMFDCFDVVAEAGLRLARVAESTSDRPLAAQRRALAGHVAFAHGDLAAAHRIWRDSLANAEELLILGLDMELCLRLAAEAIARGGDTQAATNEACAWLRPMLARASANQEHAPALLAGHAQIERLAAHPWRGALDRTELLVLDHWRHCARALGGAGTRAAPASAEEAAQAADLGASADDGDLTQREAEVLERLAAGESNKLIARAFGLSPHTVKRHVANILDKLALSSRGQAAAWFHARH